MAKEEILTRSLTSAEFDILLKVKKDPFLFSLFIYVIHPIRGKVSFNLYPYQKKVLWHFLNNRFNIILKFRQAGITELISMYCLWLAMFHPNKNIVIISIKDRVAKKVLKKIKYMYRNLPDYMQVPIVNGRNGEFGTATEMQFSNGSIISSIPTTEDAGRSEAVSLLVIDEAAIVRWANQIWAAAFPTLSTGGSAIVNSCITGDTEIVGRHGNFRVEQVCPKEFGAQDIRFMNLEVLTHKLQWKRAIYGINKGNLETWEIKNNKDKIIKCTPAHKFLTTKGWKSAQEVIEKGLYVILYEPGNSKLEEPPITVPPKKEIRVEVKDFPNYLISNLGKIYSKETGKEKESRLNKAGYKRIKLWNGGGNNKTFHISKLVSQHFIGNIPDGYVVDHINCNPLDNYSTNLQIITTKENSQRAHKFSRGLTLNTSTGKGASDVSLVGYIKYLHQVESLNGDNIIAKVYKKFNKVINRSYVSRIVNNNRNKNITISQLEVIRKYSDIIYDITVEDDESYLTDTEYINHNTPYGVGNWYHQSWVDAISGGNEFNAIRLRWQMHPERNMDWYNEMATSLGIRRTAQEIDGDFLTSGHSVFDLSSIKAIEDMLSEQRVIEQRMNGNLRLFEKPKPNTHYYIGADIATGRAQDYSAFSIMDRFGEEVGCFKGKISTDRLATLLMEMGYKYNNATIAPETNDVGLAVTSDLQKANYPNLYYSTKILRKKGKSRPETEPVPGWLTTSKNRSVIIDELEEDIRNEEIFIRDPFFIQEAYTFIYDATNRPVALGKNRKSKDEESEGQTYTDDAIMAKAITNFIRKGKKKTVVVPPQ